VWFTHVPVTAPVSGSSRNSIEMSRDLALELIIAYEGSAVLTNALAEPELMAHEARRLEKWINALQA
jgi:hypothetical protein